MFTLPTEASSILIKQRTHYEDSDDVAQTYYDDCVKEYEGFKSFLPKKDNFTFIDIGGGLGGIATIVQNSNPKATVYLFDKDGTKRQGGWHKVRKFCNSMELTNQFITVNNDEDAKTPVVLTSIEDVKKKVDVIFSSLVKRMPPT
jgi:hypothetical protein